MRLAIALMTLWCGCAAPPRSVLAPDATRTGALGQDGLYGVELMERSVRVRVDTVVPVDVLSPIDVDGTPLRSAPVVLFVQGGLVGRERYRWLGIHLASRGVVVIAPGHVLDLAFFEQGNALDVLDALQAASRRGGDSLEGRLREGPAAIVGHSLGGVVAAGAWDAAPGTLSHVALLASYPQSSVLSPRAGGRALSLLGTEDGRTSLDDAEAGVAALASTGVPVTFALIDGMSHMQFCDAVTPAEAANDGVPTIDAATARHRATFLLDAWLEDFVSGESPTLDDPSSWPDGVDEGPR